MFTFVTSSKTGQRAVGSLIKHYRRMIKSCPDEVPVVRLKVGGFKHKDSRVGWVVTPMFVVYGKTKRDDAARPDTSMEVVLNDQIPFGD